MHRSPRYAYGLISLVCAAAVLTGAGPASAASAGDTLLTSGVPLPAGAFSSSGSGNDAGGAPSAPSVSGDARYVAFLSGEDALAPGADLEATNVYRKDRVTGAVELISRTTGAGGVGLSAPSEQPVISDDGNRVAWISEAAYAPTDLDGERDVYVRDVAAGTTTLATPGVTTGVFEYDLSGDGHWIAFATEEPLSGPDDTNGKFDVYRRNLETGDLALASAINGTLTAGGAASSEPAISDDGDWVAFTSRAKNLFTNYVDGGAQRDVFARRFSQTLTVLISAKHDSATATGGNGTSSSPIIAGQPGIGANLRVGFTSNATDLADEGVTDTSTDTSGYVRRFSQAVSTLVTRADGLAGANADDLAQLDGISDDGQRVVFSSLATNLGAAPATKSLRVYTRSIATGATTVLSKANLGLTPAISADGSFAAWQETGATADANVDLPGIFGRPFPSVPIELVSRPAGSAPLVAAGPRVSDPKSGARTVSGDGRYVVFTADGAGLGNGGAGQIYRRDLRTNALDVVSRATGANGAVADSFAGEPSIDASGLRVAFVTGAALDVADTNARTDVYVRDLQAKTTTLVSRATGADGALADAPVSGASISADGNRIVFETDATTFGVGPTHRTHIYVRDLAAATTTLADRANGPAGLIANESSRAAHLSGDGRFAVFESESTNLSPDDPVAATTDIYLRDLATDTTTLLSRRNGLAGAKVTGSAFSPAISSDGSTVAFVTGDGLAAPEAGPFGGARQIVARRVATGENILVSRVAGGAVGNDDAGSPSVSADGGIVAFETRSSNLLPGLGGGARVAVFAKTIATGALSGPPAFGEIINFPNQGADYPSISEDGQCLAFNAIGHNAISGRVGDFRSAYLYVVSGSCPKPEPAVPAPAAAPAAATPGVALSAVAPTLSKVSLTNKRFKAGPGSTPLTAAAARVAAPKRKTPVGTTFAFTLNTTATVQITITRQVNGRKVGKQCVKATPKLRKSKACKRVETVGKLTRTAVPAGAQKVAFSGRLGKKKLPVGAYQAVLTATAPGGSSKPVTVPFTVVAR